MVAKRLSIHPHSDSELRAIEPTSGMDPFVSRTIHLGDESTEAAKEKHHKSVLVCDITLHSPSDCRISNAVDQMNYVDLLRWAPLVPALYKALKDLHSAVPPVTVDSSWHVLSEALENAAGIIKSMQEQDDQNTLP